jgi:hypothetical protein
MDNDICGQAWSLTGSTGTMAASLAANSLVFAMGAVADVSLATQPNLPRRGPLEIEYFSAIFTAVVSSGAPVTAGRALQLFKSSDNAQAMPTGGAALTALPKRTRDAGADSGLIANAARIATTTGLTAGAFTRGTVPLVTIDVSGLGASGNRLIYEFFEQLNGAPIYLDPGEILVVSNPAALDALLTWQLTVNVDYRRRDSY